MRHSYRAMSGVALLLLAAAGALVVAADRPGPPPPSPDPVKTLGLVRSFDEDFDGTTLNRHRWSAGDANAEVPERTLGGNGEREIYVEPAYLDLGIQPVRVHDGMMTITARPLTTVEGVVVHAVADALPPGRRQPVYGQIAYASGRITTRPTFSQRYGYFEGRLRYGGGRGIWPAFWLLPQDGSWPPEIDIMEGLGHEPDKTYSTVHYTGGATQGFPYTLTPTADGFHRYGVLWGPDTIDYYVDGVKIGSARTPPDAHKPMYVILNLAVGGFWPGYPDASTHFPATLDVDYVRAWRFPGKPPRTAGG